MSMPYEDVYRFDDAGRKRLAGLTFEETREFFELEELLDLSMSSKSARRWTNVQEARFVELLLQYEIAIQTLVDRREQS